MGRFWNRGYLPSPRSLGIASGLIFAAAFLVVTPIVAELGWAAALSMVLIPGVIGGWLFARVFLPFFSSLMGLQGDERHTSTDDADS